MTLICAWTRPNGTTWVAADGAITGESLVLYEREKAWRATDEIVVAAAGESGACNMLRTLDWAELERGPGGLFGVALAVSVWASEAWDGLVAEALVVSPGETCYVDSVGTACALRGGFAAIGTGAPFAFGWEAAIRAETAGGIDTSSIRDMFRAASYRVPGVGAECQVLGVPRLG